ncbi:pyridoxamine 5'-phosphate oxidase-domain-containing protein [Colletotrichum phormii]|uniref:Pyridoxamine 5'-phosphate oxidase-domain-containing protein n=1 Tax=Colletotrichum phormii TaxID=359342 RepID=A0AAJ0A174_9PEZI|nr:pyridoxamine 5'-phosphate oxidase-domain-containing protein [Colletotrichum phormii]KAK1640668.1 pyridoxamine 5'-phosphate oxidase-domain-containing protein [Colletotrichum phormii]
MSSSPSTSKASPGPAPWRAPFLKNVTDMASPEFNLATIHSSSSSSSASSSLTPRLRTVIFRGLWASLPVNPKNTADLNPPLYESDLLTLTTDARMAKVPDFLTNGKDSPQKSGGGGPVEACFWTDAKVQWRIRGEAYLLGPDIDASTALRSHLLARMRSVTPADAKRRREEDIPEDWSFSREITAHFGNLSPMMRGTFRNPEPGTSRAANPPTDTLKLGQKVEDLEDEVARENFRVVVVVPTEVDQTDLSDSEDPRRYLYRFVGAEAEAEAEGGAERVNGWEKTELWP